MNKWLQDTYGRRVTYMRVSVTQQCNLSCIYCGAGDCSSTTSHLRISCESMARIIRIAAEHGVRKIRLTGGEPFCAPDLIERCRACARIPGVTEVSLTTNGTLLEGRVRELRDAGVHRLNISCDARDEPTYERITGARLFHRVLRGTREAVGEGYDVRLNVVLLKGINDRRPWEFIEFARDEGVTLRFLELMPTAGGKAFQLYSAATDILEKIREKVSLEPLSREENGGTAEWYRTPQGQRVGVIAPLSAPFCAACTRIRMTAGGDLLPCLHSSASVSCADIEPDTSSALIARRLQAATGMKPWSHTINSGGESPCKMYVCGG